MPELLLLLPEFEPASLLVPGSVPLLLLVPEFVPVSLVLPETIARGKKSIGVFYGAGHMRGIEEALIGKMGFKPAGVEWRVAWDMRSGHVEGQTKPATRTD